MSEIRRISLDINKDILKSVAIECGFVVSERENEITLRRKDLYRNITYKNGELIYDDMNELQKNNLLSQVYKEQIRMELIKNNINEFTINENEDQIIITIGRER